jgi:hypothetical protein
MIQKGGAVIELTCGYALTLTLCIYAGNVCGIHATELLLQLSLLTTALASMARFK